MDRLDVYVSEGCWSCQETRRIVAEMRDQFPHIEIALFESEPESWPELIFAVPTYVLNGRVISLGNPRRHELQRKLIAGSEVRATQGGYAR